MQSEEAGHTLIRIRCVFAYKGGAHRSQREQSQGMRAKPCSKPFEPIVAWGSLQFDFCTAHAPSSAPPPPPSAPPMAANRMAACCSSSNEHYGMCKPRKARKAESAQREVLTANPATRMFPAGPMADDLSAMKSNKSKTKSNHCSPYLMENVCNVHARCALL